ncbi:2-phosphosulfolactate phosphatase [Bacillus sp. NEB1478]|uniref:2-phosphosulfolactate phosphatase n=1 Tax=Bacillus sp. NEB1478 TaxID=3073816 RepID=UPI00287386BB|nr:2-phosphosulfolactate phosphatase [Bacillus sp. NEB1478]WNB92857.1 2-phosphosulfolactate phosphatase [Bacillus sp. NEB1478]
MFDQSPYDIKFDWGIRGAREAAYRKDIIIIVDVLSFSSTVTAALQYGANIYPFPPPINNEAFQYAQEINAELVVGRAEAIKTGQHSLSPVSFSSADSGKSFVLCSLNGAACVEAAKKVPALLIGSLLNAEAAAHAAMNVRAVTKRNITIIACGERWENPSDHENELRPGIEDYLGAGAILSSLTGTFSPEAQICQKTFQAVNDDLTALIKDCGSGRELIERGFSEDVSFCTRFNISSTVPLLSNNHFVNFDLRVKN